MSAISNTPKVVTEENGTVHLTITSDGRTAKDWRESLGKKGIRLSPEVVHTLDVGEKYEAHKPTTDHLYKAVICPVSVIKRHFDRTPESIDRFAFKLKCTFSHWELAFLIREAFTNALLDNLGFKWLMFRHRPITVDRCAKEFLIPYDTRNRDQLVINPWHKTQLLLPTGGLVYVEG